MDMGATGGYALDEALREGGDACVVILVCVRVSYASAKYQVVERWGGCSQYPCTQAHRRVECDIQQRVPQAPYSWTGRINSIRVQVLITVSPAPIQPQF